MNRQELDELYLAALGAEDAGESEKALEMFRRGAEFGDDGACNAIGLAYDSGSGVEQDKERAIEWFVRAYNNGENVTYCANIALTYAEIGQLELAAQWWNRAINGGDKSASLGYAQFLLKHENYQSFEQIYGLLETAATATETLEVSADEKEQAQTLLEALRAAQTSDEKLNVWRAHEDDQMFERGGEAAKAHFTELARADANNKSARFFQMLLAIDERDLRSALAYASEVKKLSPQEQNLNLNIGRIYELAGTYDKAVAYYKKELRMFPDNELAFFNLGTTFFKLKRWKKGIFYFKRALAATDSDYEWESLRYLSIIYTKNIIHDIQNERRIYLRIMEYDPNSAVALQNLGATYLDTRDYARALEILQQARKLDDPDAMIDRNIVRAERGLAKYSKQLGE